MNSRELDVLNVLWGLDQPMTATDIVNAGCGLTQSTVTAVLRKLLKEKMVEVSGITHSGRVLSRTYRPTAESKEHILHQFVGLYKKFSNIISQDELLSAIQK